VGGRAHRAIRPDLYGLPEPRAHDQGLWILVQPRRRLQPARCLTVGFDDKCRSGDNWWHLGLYLLELGRADDALALYHERVRAARSTEWLDIVDAAALLWRLSLYGTDVAAPATALASDLSDLVNIPVYLFNDWHAVMAFGLAGDHARVARVLLANRNLAGPTNRQAADRAGTACSRASPRSPLASRRRRRAC
jgi:hypothetical protein